MNASAAGLVGLADAAPVGLTRFAISAPFARSTNPMSYCPCRSSQNRALLPKYRPSRTAVSAVIGGH
jgi:hypothetical protein